jgi:hypothetical protein
MTYHSVYIGRLSDHDDPLDWRGTWQFGNTPGMITPYFPPAHGYAQPFRSLTSKIDTGELSGKQVDWGAWAANVSKGDIIKFITEAYAGNDWYEDPNVMPHLYEQLQAVLTIARALPDSERFALVAEEF